MKCEETNQFPVLLLPAVRSDLSYQIKNPSIDIKSCWLGWCAEQASPKNGQFVFDTSTLSSSCWCSKSVRIYRVKLLLHNSSRFTTISMANGIMFSQRRPTILTTLQNLTETCLNWLICINFF